MTEPEDMPKPDRPQEDAAPTTPSEGKDTPSTNADGPESPIRDDTKASDTSPKKRPRGRPPELPRDVAGQLFFEGVP